MTAPSVWSSPTLDDEDRPSSLVDVLDRLLDRGVVVAGDIRISVAGVDLMFVGLKLFLASVDTIEAGRERQASGWLTTSGGDGVEVEDWR